MSRDELYKTAVYHQRVIRNKNNEIDRLKRRAHTVDSFDITRYIELEKHNDHLIKLLYKTYKQIASLTRTEPPSYVQVRDAILGDNSFSVKKR